MQFVYSNMSWYTVYWLGSRLVATVPCTLVLCVFYVVVVSGLPFRGVGCRGGCDQTTGVCVMLGHALAVACSFSDRQPPRRPHPWKR